MLRAVKTLGLGLCLLWLSACGHAPARPAQAPDDGSDARASAASSGNEASVPSADPRNLPVHPTFADLVDAARALDAPSAPQGSSCLLRGEPPSRFEGDVLAGVRPLPSPPDALSARLEGNAEPVTVLSAWGTTAGASELAVAAFTTTSAPSARARALVAFVTAGGVYLRGDDPALRARPGAMSVGAFGALLAEAATAADAALYVTAEAAVSLAELRSVLLAVPQRYEVALAVALPKGTRLPAPEAPSREHLCPEGLPAPDAHEPEGDIDVAALRDALAPLHEAALSCALASGSRALAGGRLTLALRIDDGGHARELCFESDELGDALLRRCVLESARSLALPAPSPKGFVDVSLPLSVSLSGPSPQRPLCD